MANKKQWGLIPLVLATGATLGVLFYQSSINSWRDHLIVDFGFYYWVANGFISTHTFGEMSNNSYFPGSLFFFLVPTLFSHTFDTYVNAFIFINVIFILIHLWLFRKNSYKGAAIFLLLIASSGPILLFRHELFPSLITLISLVLWKKAKFSYASIMLGLATSIKIYPGLIFPYYLILSLKQRGVKTLIPITLMYLAGLVSFFIPYFATGSPVTEVAKSLSFNTDKPVHIESLWASGLTIINWIPGRADQNGIFGLDMNYVSIPLQFFNTIWMGAIGVFYLWLFFKIKRKTPFLFEVPFAVILFFLVFSKVVTPQYIFWALLILPLVKFDYKVVGLAAFIAFLTQYIYPLHYNELLWQYYQDQSSPGVFYVLLIRNILLIILLCISLKNISALSSSSSDLPPSLPNS